MYEAKLIHQFDGRFGDYRQKSAGSASTTLPAVTPERRHDSSWAPEPRYWISTEDVQSRLRELWGREWLLVWRDIARSTDERTVIATIIPRVATDFTLRVGFPRRGTPEAVACLLALLNSYPFDYVSRQKLGGTHLSDYVMEQLPVHTPADLAMPAGWSPSVSVVEWVRPRVLEVIFTTDNLSPFALDLGYTGPPFRWDESRRLHLRCELDAAFFHLYGIPRADVDYIMDTFPIVRRNDEQKYGDYRAKNLILEIYDELQRAIDTSKPFVSRLDPPPGDPRAAHGAV